MGIVVRFPRRHARASSSSGAGCRAASAVRASAFSPAEVALSVIKITDHHSAGTLSRCHHLEIAAAFASGSIKRKSTAIASREGHKSMIVRNDKSVISTPIRQEVLKIKDKLSGDGDFVSGHDVLMKKGDSARVFKDHFTARVAFARHKAGYTQGEMAEFFGFGPKDDQTAQSKYQKYERRSLMPHHLIPQFCALCEVTTSWLYSGPVVARPIEKRGRKAKPSPRSATKRSIAL